MPATNQHLSLAKSASTHPLDSSPLSLKQHWAINIIVFIVTFLATWFGHRYLMPWLYTVVALSCVISGWVFLVQSIMLWWGVIHAPTRSSQDSSPTLHILGLVLVLSAGFFIGAYGTLMMIGIVLFGAPFSTTNTNEETTYVYWEEPLRARNATCYEPASWFILRPSNCPASVAPGYSASDSSENAPSLTSASPSSASPNEQTPPALPTPTVPPAIPATVEEQQLITKVPVQDADTTASEFGVFAANGSFVSAEKVAGTWVTGGEITTLGMKGEVYQINAPTSRFLVFGIGVEAMAERPSILSTAELPGNFFPPMA